MWMLVIVPRSSGSGFSPAEGFVCLLPMYIPFFLIMYHPEMAAITNPITPITIPAIAPSVSLDELGGIAGEAVGSPLVAVLVVALLVLIGLVDAKVVEIIELVELVELVKLLRSRCFVMLKECEVIIVSPP